MTTHPSQKFWGKIIFPIRVTSLKSGMSQVFDLGDILTFLEDITASE
jgi:hypothetical protein